MTEHKYFLTNKDLDTYVSFKTLDEEKNIVSNYKSMACFSSLTYAAISNRVRYVVIYRGKNSIPYTFEICARWIDDLNKLGFPCKIEDCGPNIEFWVDLSKFQYKMHLSSTLSLIRCLFENYICFVPEYYFSILESKPKKNKFQTLQNCLKKLGTTDESRYFNSNHTVTYNKNGRNVSHVQLFKRFKNTNINIYDNGYTSLEKLWNGSESYYDEFENGGNLDVRTN